MNFNILLKLFCLSGILFIYLPSNILGSPQDYSSLNEILEESPKYPDCDAIVVLEEEKYTLLLDGTSTQEYYKAIKIQDLRAKGLGAFEVSYDPNMEKVDIILARNTLPSGDVINYNEDDVRILSPPSYRYTSEKTISINLPDVQIGSTIEFSYIKTTFKPIATGDFFPVFYFQGYYPYLIQRLVVKVPEGYDLKYISRRMGKEAEPRIEMDESGTTYMWEARDVPPIKEEPNMPPYRDTVPYVKATTLSSWQDVTVWLLPMLKDNLVPDEYIKAKVRELTEGCRDIQDKVASIYHWIQGDIRYVSIGITITSDNIGHKACEVFRNRYGDCVDKSVLLVTMLRELGLSAYTAKIFTNDSGEYEREIPTYYTGNHCITLAYLDNKPVWLDPTGSLYRYPYMQENNHDVWAFIEEKCEFLKIPLSTLQENSINREIELKLIKDLSGEFDILETYNGEEEATKRYILSGIDDKKKEDILKEEVLTNYPLVDSLFLKYPDIYDLKRQFFIKKNFKVKDFAKQAGRYILFRISELDFSFVSAVSLDERNYNIVYPTTYGECLNISISLPKGYKVIYAPPNIDKDISIARFIYTSEYNKNKLLISTQFELKDRIIPVDSYSELKNLIRCATRYSKNYIILEEE